MQILTNLKGEIYNSTITVGDFDIPLSAMERLCRQKIKDTLELNHTVEQMDLTDIYRTFHPTTEYTFSGAHEHSPGEIIR